MDTKYALLNRACLPLLKYRCSRWPPQRQIGIELDRLQTRMVAAMMRVPRGPGEPPDAYCKRRNKTAAAFCRRKGVWSRCWYERAILWDEHLARGHSAHSWPTLLHDFQDMSWLEVRRCLRERGGHGLRQARGRPCVRWHEGIVHAHSCQIPWQVLMRFP